MISDTTILGLQAVIDISERKPRGLARKSSIHSHMNIIWTMPCYNEPSTGAEHFYYAMHKWVSARMSVTCCNRLSEKQHGNVFMLLMSNFIHLCLLMRAPGGSVILEDAYFRRKFFFANIILYGIFRRNIAIFVNESFCDIEKLSDFKGLAVRMLFKLYFRYSRLIIVNSNSTKNWVNTFGGFSHKINVVYPVIRVQIKNLEYRRALSERGCGRVLCVSNIRKSKGQEFLVKALENLSDKNIKIYFAGAIKEQGYYDYLTNMVNSLGLSGRVAFKGFVKGEELCELYKNSDIAVLPTLKEGFGMAVVEAMSYGLPVIASRVGGICEIIDSGVNGILTEPSNPGELAQEIRNLVDDKAKRDMLGRNALVKYNSLPTLDETFGLVLKALS